MPLPRSRNDAIRTRDLIVPNDALYQAEPHSDFLSIEGNVFSSTFYRAQLW